MNLFQLDKVNFGYHPSRPVLHDISFSLQQGRNIGLVGESGSGKSTILRLLLGLNRANSGTITFLGEEFTPGNRSFMRRYRKAVQPVFQDPYSSLDHASVSPLPAQSYRGHRCCWPMKRSARLIYRPVCASSICSNTVGITDRAAGFA